MNKKFLIIVLLLSFAVSRCNEKLVAEKKAAEMPLKIKIVEGKRIISESAEGKDLETRIMEVRNKYDKEIKSLDKDIEKEITELRSRARTVDPEILEKDQERIMRKKKERDAKAESAQEEFERTVKRELGKFNIKAQDKIVRKAQEQDLDLVSIKETGEIVYISNRVDWTNDIIRDLDNDYKKEKKPAQEKPAAAPVAQKK